jgi:hypothetical protein
MMDEGFRAYWARWVRADASLFETKADAFWHAAKRTPGLFDDDAVLWLKRAHEHIGETLALIEEYRKGKENV